MTNNNCEKGFLVVAHGSARDEANERVFALTRRLKSYFQTDVFEPAFMELASPSIEDGIKRLIDRGIDELIVYPFFLFKGMHLSVDVPNLIEKALSMAKQDRRISYKILDPIGMHNRIFNLAEEMIYDYVIEQLSLREIEPSGIEDKSMDIIEGYLENYEIGIEERPIIKRVIHTTGDLDFISNMIFYGDAVSIGRKALREMRAIYTDVTMVQAGINKRFNHEVTCLLNESVVGISAEREGSTRAAAGIKRLNHHLDGNIVVIGNAPTALAALVDMVKNDGVKPSLIIGIPVGFVNAKEAKSYLTRLNEIPYITNRGHKGGSTVAVSIINALIKMEFMEKGGDS